ncbi:MAG: XrtA/PEP-CTERM system TPR-repeat protein PrsT, partial [Gammaproteobacteria bacterium]
RNAVQAERSHVPSWLLLARTHLEVGDPAAALHEAQEAQKFGADIELTATIIARSQLMLGEVEALTETAPPRSLSQEKRTALLVIQAAALLQSNRLADARKRFEEALALAPDNVDARRGLALALARLGRGAPAQREAERAIALAPNDAESHYVRGEIRRARGEFVPALEDFERAVSLDPHHSPALLGKAAVLLDSGRLEEAHRLLLELNARAPDELQGLYLLSQTQIALGDEAGADETLAAARRRLQEIPPDAAAENLPALMLTAVLALRDGQPDRARDALRAYLQRNADHIGATKLLAVALLQLGNGAEALTQLRRLEDAYPDDPHLALLSGAAHALEGNVEQALAANAKATGRGAGRAWLYKLLGLSQARRGDNEAALSAFDAALELDPAAQDALLMAAYTQIQLGRIEQAREVVDRLRVQHPESAAYENIAGALATMRGDRGAAAAHFERAAAITPDFLAPQLNLAEIARQERQYAEAEARYARILENDRSSIAALRGLAEVAATRGANDEAIRWLERIKKLRPELVEDRAALMRAYLTAGRGAEALAEAHVLATLAPERVDVIVQAASVERRFGSSAAARSLLLELGERPRLSARERDLVAATQAKLNFPGDARKTREATLRRWPDRTETRLAIAMAALEAGDVDQALEQHAILLERAAGEAATLLLGGEIALARGDPEAAVEAFTQASRQEPGAVSGRRLAAALLAAGDTERAIDVFRRSLGPGEHSPRKRMALAVFLLRAGRYADAAAIYEAIVRQSPDDWRAYNNLAWAYEMLGDPRAVPTVRAALRLNPEHPATLDTAGWILGRSGAHEEALGLLREALARDASTTSIRLHLAELLVDMKRPAEAREHLERITGTADGEEARRVADLLARLGPTDQGVKNPDTL